MKIWITEDAVTSVGMVRKNASKIQCYSNILIARDRIPRQYEIVIP